MIPNFTLSEQSFFRCLENIDADTSLWALAIVNVIETGDASRFRALVTQLKSQAVDGPETMKSILGEGCYQQLIAL